MCHLREGALERNEKSFSLNRMCVWSGEGIKLITRQTFIIVFECIPNVAPPVLEVPLTAYDLLSFEVKNKYRLPLWGLLGHNYNIPQLSTAKQSNQPLAEGLKCISLVSLFPCRLTLQRGYTISLLIWKN